MTRITTRTAALFAALLALSACETIEGAGQDIQSAGQTIEGEAQETQAEM
ncbi:MAG: entericidin A/B family lipoprotein [Rhodobacteraceae bacterium]|nr:entericidin A/B family lipoprotein [Paracoccaceae bacterium]MBR9820472.1 entericidin A/B family lipoprotein [Paracoccaceae bacterium]